LLLTTGGELAEAEEALQRALASPLCAGEERGNAHYNLACAFARSDEEEMCRQHLLSAKEHKGLDAKLARKDTDLESVREKPWFGDLLNEEDSPE